MRIPGILLVCCGLLAWQPAASQDASTGLFNAVAFRPLPDGAAVRVRPLDNSDENLALQQEFERELTARGHTVSENAPLVITFEVRDEIGAWSTRDRRTVLELEGRGDSLGGHDHKARLNLFDSDRGGILNQGRGSGTSITTPSEYRIDATIDDRTNGRRLWQAWVTADLGYSDGPTLTRAMIPVIIGNLGKTVKRQPFELP